MKAQTRKYVGSVMVVSLLAALVALFGCSQDRTSLGVIETGGRVSLEEDRGRVVLYGSIGQEKPVPAFDRALVRENTVLTASTYRNGQKVDPEEWKVVGTTLELDVSRGDALVIDGMRVDAAGNRFRIDFKLGSLDPSEHAEAWSDSGFHCVANSFDGNGYAVLTPQIVNPGNQEVPDVYRDYAIPDQDKVLTGVKLVSATDGAFEVTDVVPIFYDNTVGCWYGFNVGGEGDLDVTMQASFRSDRPCLTEANVELYVNGEPALQGHDSVRTGRIVGVNYVATGDVVYEPPADPPTLQWSLASQTVDEGVGQVEVVAEVSGKYCCDVRGNFALGGTAAVSGKDYYLPEHFYVTIPAGETSGSVVIKFIDDEDDDDGEDVTLTLVDSPTSGVVVSGTVTHRINIQDNDLPGGTVLIQEDTTSTSENDWTVEPPEEPEPVVYGTDEMELDSRGKLTILNVSNYFDVVANTIEVVGDQSASWNPGDGLKVPVANDMAVIDLKLLAFLQGANRLNIFVDTDGTRKGRAWMKRGSFSEATQALFYRQTGASSEHGANDWIMAIWLEEGAYSPVPEGEAVVYRARP